MLEKCLRYICKNVTESLSEKVTSREAIASKNDDDLRIKIEVSVKIVNKDNLKIFRDVLKP